MNCCRFTLSFSQSLSAACAFFCIPSFFCILSFFLHSLIFFASPHFFAFSHIILHPLIFLHHLIILPVSVRSMCIRARRARSGQTATRFKHFFCCFFKPVGCDNTSRLAFLLCPGQQAGDPVFWHLRSILWNRNIHLNIALEMSACTFHLVPFLHQVCKYQVRTCWAAQSPSFTSALTPTVS